MSVEALLPSYILLKQYQNTRGEAVSRGLHVTLVRRLTYFRWGLAWHLRIFILRLSLYSYEMCNTCKFLDEPCLRIVRIVLEKGERLVLFVVKVSDSGGRVKIVE
jgi:hypothetical protein